MQKIQGGQTINYAYDAQGGLAAEYRAQAETSPCATCYLSFDHLGSTRLVTNEQGQIVARHDYLPFGEEITEVGGRTSLWGGTDAVNQRFTGQERDGETQLDFFQARYFSAAQQRFLSPDPGNAGADPMNPQSWNAYAYVNNNPLNAIDPTGLETWSFGGCYFNTAYSYVDGEYQGSSTNFLGCFGLGNGGSSSRVQESVPPPPQKVHVEDPPKNGTKQTFSQCMAAHSNDFSMAGTVNHGFNAIFGTTSLAAQNNFFAQAVFGNPITTFLYGSATDNAGTALSFGPTVTQMGMGSVISYGRRTTTIMSLNLAGKGGVPLALGAASGTKAAIGQVAKVAGGFMSLEMTFGVNAGFTALEAAYCASQP